MRPLPVLPELPEFLDLPELSEFLDLPELLEGLCPSRPPRQGAAAPCTRE